MESAEGPEDPTPDSDTNNGPSVHSSRLSGSQSISQRDSGLAGDTWPDHRGNSPGDHVDLPILPSAQSEEAEEDIRHAHAIAETLAGLFYFQEILAGLFGQEEYCEYGCVPLDHGFPNAEACAPGSHVYDVHIGICGRCGRLQGPDDGNLAFGISRDPNDS